MEMRVTITGTGIGIEKIGFNFLSYAYIECRRCGSLAERTLALSKGLSLGSSSGTFVYGSLQTDWFTVDSTEAEWINNDGKILGNVGEIEVVGTIINGGRVDVRIDLIGTTGTIKSLLAKANLKARGFQISPIKVRGTFVRLHDKALCD